MPQQFQTQGLGLIACKAAELPDNYVEQLVQKSRQPHVLEYEGHEDVGTAEEPGRFRDVSAYREWSSGKERVMYLMVNEVVKFDIATPDIGGVIWFGRRTNDNAPDREVTFAIRNYDEDQSKGWGKYRGCKLGTPFMQATHQDVANIYPNERLWLDLVDGNEAALSLYKRNGYEELVRLEDETHGGQKRIVMANDTALMTPELGLKAA